MASKPLDQRTLRAAQKALRRKIQTLSDKALRQNLEMFCGDDVREAYRQGVEEAQSEMLNRLLGLYMAEDNRQRAEMHAPNGNSL